MKTRVLLAEDHPDLCDVLSRQLRVLGYEVATAMNGLDAVAMALSQPPDIILMDILMPEMDGLQAISQIRGNPAIRQIPVLAVTGWVTPDSRKEFLARGFNDCIAKPFTYRALQSVIGKVLEAENQKSKTSDFPGENCDGTKSD